MRIIASLASAAVFLLASAALPARPQGQPGQAVPSADSSVTKPDQTGKTTILIPALPERESRIDSGVALAAGRTPTGYRLRTVVLDAGHGGKDRGCAGASAREADVALKLILALGKQIEANLPDVKVIYTRKTNVFVELDERAAIANRHHADLFISIHCNAGPSQSHGTEVWTMGLHKTDANLGVAQRENSVILQEKDYQKRYDGFDPRSPQSHILFSLFQSAYITNSLRFAQRVDRQLRTTVSRPSRGVKQAGFLVLWKSTMPSVLIESGFLTNPTEEKYLNSASNQADMAAGIYRAFREYKRDLEGG